MTQLSLEFSEEQLVRLETAAKRRNISLPDLLTETVQGLVGDGPPGTIVVEGLDPSR